MQSSTGAVSMHSVLCIASVTTLLFRSRVVREAKAHRCSCSPTLGCVKLGLQSSAGAANMHSVLCIVVVTTLLFRSRVVREATSS